MRITTTLAKATPACACGGYIEAGDTLGIVEGTWSDLPAWWVECPDCGNAIGLARRYPVGVGCGKPTRVAGTNGGLMACGGKLRHLDGSITVEFCARCVPGPSAGMKGAALETYMAEHYPSVI